MYAEEKKTVSIVRRVLFANQRNCKNLKTVRYEFRVFVFYNRLSVCLHVHTGTVYNKDLRSCAKNIEQRVVFNCFLNNTRITTLYVYLDNGLPKTSTFPYFLKHNFSDTLLIFKNGMSQKSSPPQKKKIDTCAHTNNDFSDRFFSDVEMQLVLDAKKPKSPRIFFLSEENRNVLNNSLTLEKNVQFCKKFNVYLKVKHTPPPSPRIVCFGIFSIKEWTFFRDVCRENQ